VVELTESLCGKPPLVQLPVPCGNVHTQSFATQPRLGMKRMWYRTNHPSGEVGEWDGEWEVNVQGGGRV